MAFPREVRGLVYDFVVRDCPQTIHIADSRTQAPVLGGSSNVPLVTFLPSFAYVSQGIFSELVPAFIRRVNLEIASAPDIWYLESFLEALPSADGWGKITNLSLVNLSFISSSPARAAETMDMIIRAVNLNTLVIGLSLGDLYLPPDWSAPPTSADEANELMDYPPRKATAQFLIRECKLDALYNMSKLTRVIIKIEHGWFHSTPASTTILNELAEQLNAGFEATSGVNTETSLQWLNICDPNMSIILLGIKRLALKE
ncbi:hypothetical protein T440DRAFT_542740 [Plenodomus tracheiphilus IPT5]|uniref:Uncharacterized protein n=1 Tax=Plenodomus tracheiphilus IPT5 TaxID=1408161 RepID=A0A6A7ASU0_9PLEO|nr:hypothetical protein T440DRAFT_542740 [Plenodomus tracheiphilus IPT5]